MADSSGANRSAIASPGTDFLVLLLKAVGSGIAASVVFALAALGLATTASAQPAPGDATRPLTDVVAVQSLATRGRHPQVAEPVEFAAAHPAPEGAVVASAPRAARRRA